MGFWYMYPVARDDSAYTSYGPSQKLKNPQQQGGAVFGIEMMPFERPHQGHKVWVDLRGRLEGHFAGRGYGEMWELLASAPPLGCDAAQIPYNPACNPAATTNAYQGQPFSGVTTIENYASLGFDMAVGAEVAK